MPTIEKRGQKSFRARVSIMEHGKQKQVTKTFTTKSEAKTWAHQQEVLKGKGKNMYCIFGGSRLNIFIKGCTKCFRRKCISYYS